MAAERVDMIVVMVAAVDIIPLVVFLVVHLVVVLLPLIQS